MPDFGSYVCSGFLLMNLVWMRRNSIEERLFSFLRGNPTVVTPDQSALNWTCRGHIGLLPHRWGCFNNECWGDQMPAVIHYANGVPWRKPQSWMFYWGENLVADLWIKFYKNIVGGEMKRPFVLRLWLKAKVAYYLLKVMMVLGISNKYVYTYGSELSKRKNMKGIQQASLVILGKSRRFPVD